MMKNNVPCPVCGDGSLHADSAESSLLAKGRQVGITRVFHWCGACGVEVTLDQDARTNARGAMVAYRRASGRMTGDEIKELRVNILKISQVDASKIFGGGVVAFSKYENNDVPPSDAMDNLLWLVSRHSDLVFELAERAGVLLQNPNVRTKILPISADYSRTLVKEIRAAQINTGIGALERAKFVEGRTSTPISNQIEYDSLLLQAA